MTTKLRVQFDGKTLVPLDPVDLPTGQVLDVEVRETQRPSDEERRNAILKVLEAVPPISADDAAELERLIEEGQSPTERKGAFDENVAKE
jgi:hypothetical protein